MVQTEKNLPLRHSPKQRQRNRRVAFLSQERGDREGSNRLFGGRLNRFVFYRPFEQSSSKFADKKWLLCRVLDVNADILVYILPVVVVGF